MRSLFNRRFLVIVSLAVLLSASAVFLLFQHSAASSTSNTGIEGNSQTGSIPSWITSVPESHQCGYNYASYLVTAGNISNFQLKPGPIVDLLSRSITVTAQDYWHIIGAPVTVDGQTLNNNEANRVNVSIPGRITTKVSSPSGQIYACLLQTP